jgi:subtilisin family serine protease
MLNLLKFLKFLKFLILLISINLSAQERVLIAKTAPLNHDWQQYVVQDLTPLDWLVLELPADKLRHLRRKHTVYADIRGSFANNNNNYNDNSQQWHLHSTGAAQMWQQTQGEGIIIALIDSGVDEKHPDLAGKILFEQGYDFGDDKVQAYDRHGHGTEMAGLLVANCNNQIGSCGIAPLAKLIPYKLNTQDSSGFGLDSFSSANLAAAILAATASPATILNMSVFLHEQAPWVEQAVIHAKQQGKILVAPSGNNATAQVSFPANLPIVLGVGAHDENNQPLAQNNYGDGLDLLAPGFRLWTTQMGGGYTDFNTGTSAATAVVSGLLALLQAANPNLSAAELLTILLNSSADWGELGYDELSGFGLAKLPALTTDLAVDSVPELIYYPKTKKVYHYYDKFVVYLASSRLQNRSGDLYLRFGFPVTADGQRSQVYKIWQQTDTIMPVPYNINIASPMLFTDDFELFLFGGAEALFGDGIVCTDLVAGAYEFLAYAVLNDGQTVVARKIVWLSLEIAKKYGLGLAN